MSAGAIGGDGSSAPAGRCVALRVSQPSGAELEEAAAGGRQIRVGPGRALSQRRLIVTKLAQPAEAVVAFYNQRGTCEQFIKEGKGAIEWTRLSGRTCHQRGSLSASRRWLQSPQFRAKPGDAEGGRTVVTSPAAPRKLIKIGAKVVSQGRYITFQMVEVAVPRQMSADILSLITRLRAPAAPA